MSTPISRAEQADAELFYAALGRAFARWSSVEFSLGALFYKMTPLNQDQARQIFHSGRSWRTKRDLLNAAIATCPAPLGMRRAFQAVLDKGESYAKFRNIIAHNAVQIAPFTLAKPLRRLCIRPHSASLEASATDRTYWQDDIDTAAGNFDLLAALLALSITKNHEEQLGSPERLSWLCGQLPDDPSSTSLSPEQTKHFLLGTDHRPFPL